MSTGAGSRCSGVLPPAHVDVSGFDVTAVIAWWREAEPGGGHGYPRGRVDRHRARGRTH